MQTSQRPSVSVIIPVYNGGHEFVECLFSLAATLTQPIEVIVVADGDTDGSWLVAKEFGAKVIRLPAAGGPARARNIGAKAAHGDILFFVDADVAIYPETIGQVAEIFEKNPQLAAAIGSYDNSPGAKNFLSQYKNLLHHYTHQTACEEASTFWGACGAIRREIFLELGGFDENYHRPSIEDIELGYRLKAAGYQIQLCKTLEVKHLKRWGIISLLRADIFYRALPWTELILQSDQGLINDLNLQTSSRLSVLLTYTLLVALIGIQWGFISLLIAALCALGLIALNAPVYRFFKRRRGLKFAVKTIPWHWLYYFYSGLAFGIGLCRHLFTEQKLLKLVLQKS